VGFGIEAAGYWMSTHTLRSGLLPPWSTQDLTNANWEAYSNTPPTFNIRNQAKADESYGLAGFTRA